MLKISDEWMSLHRQQPFVPVFLSLYFESESPGKQARAL